MHRDNVSNNKLKEHQRYLLDHLPILINEITFAANKHSSSDNRGN